MSRFLLTLLFILSATSGCECELDSVWTMLESAFTGARHLGENAHSYLVSLIGKEAVNTIFKMMKDFIKITSEATASALNVAAVYITELLTAAGVDFDLPVKRVTPEGVVFVAQWTLLVVFAYWILSLTIRLLVDVFRQTLFLIKLGLAVSAFVMILSDTGATTETTGMRLAGLVFVCVLLGVGPSCFKRDTGSHLEKRVKKLEDILDLDQKRTERQ